MDKVTLAKVLQSLQEKAQGFRVVAMIAERDARTEDAVQARGKSEKCEHVAQGLRELFPEADCG